MSDVGFLESLENILEGGDQGADDDPRIGKRALEPAGLGWTRNNGSVARGNRAFQRATDAIDRRIEGLLADGGGSYEIFESVIHTISLFSHSYV